AAQGGMGYAVRKLGTAAMMSPIRWRPRHKVWVPGSRSYLRARKPPSWAMERIIWRSEGGCPAGGLRAFKQMTAFHGVSRRRRVGKIRRGAAQPGQLMDAPGHDRSGDAA